MFTGLIAAVGVVREVRPLDGGVELTFDVSWVDLAPGESVAVDGACLTVAEHGEGWFRVHVVATSLERTTFGSYSAKRRVNLERALRVGDRLGGHMVQGHVDGIGEVLGVADHADVRLIEISVPPEVSRVSIPLGSVTVDGVSLTINAIAREGLIQVAIIPFTLQHTTLHERLPGDRVHLEGDLVGKYLKTFLNTPSSPERGA